MDENKVTTPGAEGAATEINETTFASELAKSQRLADLEAQLAALAKQNAELLAHATSNRELSQWTHMVQVRSFDPDDFLQQGPQNWGSIARNHALAQLAGHPKYGEASPGRDYMLGQYVNAVLDYAQMQTSGRRTGEQNWDYERRLAEAKENVRQKTLWLDIRPLLSGRDFDPDA